MARTKIQISVTPVTLVTPDFLKVSRVLRTRIMRTGVTRTYLHGTREKFTHYSVTGVTVHLYGWDPSAAITCATTTDATLTFHNVCALLKITNGRGDGCKGHNGPGPVVPYVQKTVIFWGD